MNLRRSDLITSDVDAKDVYLPNGNWNNNQYETLSYLTSITWVRRAAPITELPPSFPPYWSRARLSTTWQRGYIERRSPEQNLYHQIVGDTPHQIITLFGSGGMGKTWLTLEVLDKVAKSGKFNAILWFSARDIDLLADGAREVKPHILTEKDIALEFKKLIGPWLLSAEAMNADPVRLHCTRANSVKYYSYLIILRPRRIRRSFTTGFTAIYGCRTKHLVSRIQRRLSRRIGRHVLRGMHATDKRHGALVGDNSSDVERIH